jgi:2-dehydropantoate 2-reductase
MKVLVYGAGAVGGYLGARLAHSGHEVTLVARQFMADIVNKDGLRLVTEAGVIETAPQVHTSIASAYNYEEDGAAYDVILLTMKSYDLSTALDHLSAFCLTPPTIITMQNGIGVESPFINHYGAAHIVAGSLTTPVSRESSNRLVEERADRGLGLAPTQRGGDIRRWAAMFRKAGIETTAVADYRAMKWSKALLNMVGNATSAILNRAPSSIYKAGPLFDLERRMLGETLDVMEALQIDVIDLPGSPASRLAFGVRRMPKLLLKPLLTRLVAGGRGGKMPSFHIDLSAGKKKNEVIYHNGAVAKAGQKAGIPTPVNFTLTTVLMKLARGEVDWREYNGAAGRLLKDVRRREKAIKSRK